MPPTSRPPLPVPHPARRPAPAPPRLVVFAVLAIGTTASVAHANPAPPGHRYEPPDPECSPAREESRGWVDCEVCVPHRYHPANPWGGSAHPHPEPIAVSCAELRDRGLRHRCRSQELHVMCRRPAPHKSDPYRPRYSVSCSAAAPPRTVPVWLSIAAAWMWVATRRRRRHAGDVVAARVPRTRPPTSARTRRGHRTHGT